MKDLFFRIMCPDGLSIISPGKYRKKVNYAFRSVDCIYDMLFITTGKNCSHSSLSFIMLFVKMTWK